MMMNFTVVNKKLKEGVRDQGSGSPFFELPHDDGWPVAFDNPGSGAASRPWHSTIASPEAPEQKWKRQTSVSEEGGSGVPLFRRPGHIGSTKQDKSHHRGQDFSTPERRTRKGIGGLAGEGQGRALTEARSRQRGEGAARREGRGKDKTRAAPRRAGSAQVFCPCCSGYLLMLRCKGFLLSGLLPARAAPPRR